MAQSNSNQGGSGPAFYNYGGYGVAPKPVQPPEPKGPTAKQFVLIAVAILSVATVFCAGVLGVWFLPGIVSQVGFGSLSDDVKHLRLVGLALHTYHDNYKCFPTPYSTNSNGNVVWSWRVAILPNVERSDLYNKLNRKDMKPWDHPDNSFLQGESPLEFQSTRAGNGAKSNLANVFLISNPERLGGDPAFIDGTYTKLASLKDGTSNIILAVMLVNYSVPWASPVDLTPDEAFDLIKKEDRYFLALFADGAVAQLPVDIDKETFMGFVTRAGGEALSRKEYLGEK